MWSHIVSVCWNVWHRLFWAQQYSVFICPQTIHNLLWIIIYIFKVLYLNKGVVYWLQCMAARRLHGCGQGMIFLITTCVRKCHPRRVDKKRAVELQKRRRKEFSSLAGFKRNRNRRWDNTTGDQCWSFEKQGSEKEERTRQGIAVRKETQTER